MTTAAQRIRKLYGFDFPEGFFRFADFIKQLPAGILEEMCDMRPAYPFAAAEGKPPRYHQGHPLWEDRYYHDLPEFVTLFLGSTDGLHWGYFFDAPGRHEPVVVHYWHSDTFQHAFDGDTLFEALRRQVEVSARDYQDMIDDDPDWAEEYRHRLGHLAFIREQLAEHWNAERSETGEAYLRAHHGSQWRNPVAQTWSRLGILVARRSYRSLASDPFTAPFKGSPLEPDPAEIQALSVQAMGLLHKGYPGAALKLGHDLWAWADEFPECYELLDAAYAALGREQLRPLLAEARAYRAWCDESRPRKT